MIDGSRFSGPAIPILHAHRRRASAQYVDSRVRVGVGSETTVSTGEAGLALATSLVDGSTFRAGLRRVGGIDLHERPAALFKLVRKDVREGAPPLLQDGAVKAALPLAASGHVLGFQVFDCREAKAVNKNFRRLVPPLSSASADFCCDAREASALFAIPVRPSNAARQRTLSSLLSAIEMQQIGRGQHLAGGKSESVSDPAIDTYSWQIAGLVWRLNSANNRGVPISRDLGDGHVQRVTFQPTGMAKANPTKVRYSNLPPARIYLSQSDVFRLNSEAVVYTFLSELRKVVRAAEEQTKSAIQVSKCLRKGIARHICDPFNFRSQRCDLLALANEVQLVASRALEFTPPVPALLKGQIVNQPCDAREMPQAIGLLCGRSKPIAKGSLEHALSYSELQEGHNP